MSHILSLAGAAERETVLCLHCSGSGGRQWGPIAAALSPHRQVVAPDLLGYGSDRRWPAGQRVTLDDEADALAPWLEGGPLHLFGHSYGGTVALQIALRWPERVRSLTLYEPVRFALLFREPATEATGRAIVRVGRRIGQEVMSGALAAAGQRFVDYWSGEGAWQRLAPARQAALALRMTKVHAEFEALFADAVPATAYRALHMPVQLIGGTRSPLPARQVLDRLAAQLPHAVRSTLGGLGHMGPLEAPQRLLESLAAPLQGRDVLAEVA